MRAGFIGTSISIIRSAILAARVLHSNLLTPVCRNPLGRVMEAHSAGMVAGSRSVIEKLLVKNARPHVKCPTDCQCGNF